MYGQTIMFRWVQSLIYFFMVETFTFISLFIFYCQVQKRCLNHKFLVQFQSGDLFIQPKQHIDSIFLLGLFALFISENIMRLNVNSALFNVVYNSKEFVFV